MSGFDPEQYFNKAYAGTLGSDSIESIATFRTTKERELAVASARKAKQLATSVDQAKLRIQDVRTEVAGGALQGTGALISGVGDLLTVAGNLTGQVVNKVLPDEVEQTIRDLPAPSDFFRAAGQQVRAGGTALTNDKTNAGLQAMQDSTPTGDVLKPSTWDLGEDPSLAGYALHAANLAGQFIPQAVALATPAGQTRLLTMMGVGGLQAGGAGGDEAVAHYAAMTDEQLRANSGLYRELVDNNIDPDEARQQILATARTAAFQGAAPMGTVGGAATHYALGPLQKALGGNAANRLFAGATIDAPVEGLQEVSEVVAGRANTNLAIDAKQDITENTFADALLGSMGGGGIAALGAGVSGIPEGVAAIKAGAEWVQDKRAEYLVAAEDAASAASKEDAPTLSPEEQRDADKLAVTSARVKVQNSTPEGQAKIKEQILRFEAATISAKTDEEKQAAAQVLSVLQKSLLGKGGKKVADKELALAEERLAASELLYQDSIQTNNKEGELREQVNLATATADPAIEGHADKIQAATSQLLKTATENPHLITPDTAEELASSPNFDEGQQQLFRDLAKYSRLERDYRSTGAVMDDILLGDQGSDNVSLVEHQQRIDKALATGDLTASQKASGALSSFASAKVKKATALTQAYQRYVKTGNAQQIIPDGQGGWISPAKTMTMEALHKVNGLEVASHTKKAIQGAVQEAELLQAAANLATGRVAALSKPAAAANPQGTGLQLPATGNRYLPKDQAKAAKANKFIGQGAEGSSTAKYAEALTAQGVANTGNYTTDDVVFISANGNRSNRMPFDQAEVQLAVEAGATLITDTAADRARGFNTGEREVAAFLTDKGYVDQAGNGIWTPAQKSAEVKAPASVAKDKAKAQPKPQSVSLSEADLQAVHKVHAAIEKKYGDARTEILQGKLAGKQAQLEGASGKKALFLQQDIALYERLLERAKQREAAVADVIDAPATQAQETTSAAQGPQEDVADQDDFSGIQFDENEEVDDVQRDAPDSGEFTGTLPADLSRLPKATTARKNALRLKLRALGVLQNEVFFPADATTLPDQDTLDQLDQLSAEVRQALVSHNYGNPRHDVELMLMLANPVRLVSKPELYQWAKRNAGASPHLLKILRLLFKSSATADLKGFNLYTTLHQVDDKAQVAVGTSTALNTIGLNPLGSKKGALLVLVHEIVHAATRHGLKEAVALRAELIKVRDAVVAYLDAHPKAFSAAVRHELRYATQTKEPGTAPDYDPQSAIAIDRSINELLAVALSDTKAADALNQIPLNAEVSVSQGIGQKILGYIRDLLKLSQVETSALAGVLNVADQLIADVDDRPAQAQAPVTAASVDFEADVAIAEASLLNNLTLLNDLAEVDESGVRVAEGQEVVERASTSHLGKTEGILDLFTEDSAEDDLPLNAETYSRLNLLRRMFKQVGERDDSATPRPLVAIKNFVSRWKAGEVSAADFLTSGVTSSQQVFLQYFRDSYPEWQQALNKLVAVDVDKHGVAQTDYRHLNALQFFLDQNGQLEENAATAIIAVAQGFLTDAARSPESRTDAEINRMFGRSKKLKVAPELRRLVGTTLGREQRLYASLGAQVFQALGITAKDKHTLVNEQARMESAVGAMVLVLLQDMGLLERVSVSAQAVDKALGKDTVAGEKVVDFFVRVQATGNGKQRVLPPITARLHDLVAGSGGVFSRLFAIEGGEVYPTATPQKYVQKVINKGKQGVHGLAQKALSKLSKEAYTFRPAMLRLGVTTPQGRQFVEELLGLADTSADSHHIAVRESEQARVDNIRQEIDGITDLIKYASESFADGVLSPFYVGMDLWKNQRFGYVGTKAAMQTSKVHRFFYQKAAWHTEVDLQVGSPSLESFQLRVMEGLDIKTDDGVNAVHLAKWDGLVNDPVNLAATTALQKILVANAQGGYQQLTTQDREAIAAAVKKGKTKLHSLEALMAMAEYQHAVATDATSFDSTLSAEIDGKTNGVMLSNWLLGTITAALAERGGFFARGAEHQHFSAWKPGRHDIYQRLALLSFSVLNDLRNAGGDPIAGVISALDRLSGELVKGDEVTSAGRNMLKDPLIALNYGSGIARAKTSMGEAFLEGVYATIAKLHNGGTYHGLEGEAGLQALQADLNQLMSARSVRHFVDPSYRTYALKTVRQPLRFTSTAETMDSYFTPQQVKDLLAGHAALLGGSVAEAMQTELGAYIKTRQVLVSATNLSFSLYSTLYTGIRQATLANLIDRGEIKTNKLGQAVHDLTLEQEQQVRALVERMEPRIRSAASTLERKESGADTSLDNGFYLPGRTPKADKSPAFKGRLTYAGPEGKKVTRDTSGYAVEDTAPGVSVMSSGVQGTDGSIMLSGVLAFDAIGVHDAIMLAVGNAEAAGRELNKATYDNLVAYSLPREVYEAMERSLVGLEFSLSRWGKPELLGEATQTAALQILDLLGKWGLLDTKAPRVDVGSLLQILFSKANQADRAKLEGLIDLETIDQYTIQNGAWHITDTQRAAAQAKLDALPTAIAPSVLKAMARLQVLLDNSLTYEPDIMARLKEHRDQKLEAIVAGDLFTVSEVNQALSEDEETEVLSNETQETIDISGDLASSPSLDEDLEFTTLGVYEDLNQGSQAVLDPAQDSHLRNLLETVVDKLHGPFQGLYLTVKNNALNAPADVFHTAVADGHLTFTSSLQYSPFVQSEAQSFVAEMVQLVVAESFKDSTTQAQKQLTQLYQEAREVITPADLDPDPVQGQAMWDSLFTVQPGDLKGEYLIRFAALGLTHPAVNKALGFTTTTRVEVEATTLYGRLMNWFNTLLNWLNAEMDKAYGGQQGDTKLLTIVSRLVDLEADRVSRQNPGSLSQMLERLSVYTTDLGEQARNKVATLTRIPALAQSNSTVVRTLSTLVGQAAEHRLEETFNGLADFYNTSVEGRAGEFMELLNELRGTTNDRRVGHITLLLTKFHEKIRKEVSSNVSKVVYKAFENAGKALTPLLRGQITDVLLRADVQSLLGAYSLADVQRFLADPAALQSAINAEVSQLGGKWRHYYRNQATHLGYYMATGNVTSSNLQQTALGIADLSGTTFKGQVNDAAAEAAAKVVDRLASLQALRYTSVSAKTAVSTLMLSESARQDGGNGVEFVVKLQRDLRSKAAKDNFAGSERLMLKGYVPNIVDPRVETKVVAVADVAGLKAQGWRELGPVGIDRTTGKGPHVMMVINRGLRHRLTGTLGLDNLKAKGASHAITDRLEVTALQAAKQTDTRKLFNPAPNLDPAKISDTYLVPLTNDQGTTVGYRYVASHETMQRVYHRNNDFDALLGSEASAVYSKKVTATSNVAIMDALRAQWEAQKGNRRHDFIYVGSQSKDPEVLQSYLLLPESTRAHIRATWGADGMMVRRDTYLMHFGYRKFGLEEMFSKDPAERMWAEKLFVWIVEDVFHLGPKAGLRVRQAQDIWEALVKEIKDFIVVKTGATLFWNVVSNFTMLYLREVSFADMYRYHRVALKGALAWNKDAAELRQLVTMQSAGYTGNVRDLEHRIAELRSAMHRNPVREVIEAGMMPTIVEDVEADVEQFNYKSDFTKQVEKYTEGIPKPLQTAGRWLYMTHDTPLYKVLSQGTQLSDFVARYTLYQHSRNKKKDPLSHEEALLLASDAFVNYDIPSGKGLQFANDMGLVMFTKYYVRVQRALQAAAINSPIRALSLGLVDNYFLGIQTILDSSLLTHNGINLAMGALEYPDAVFQGLPMKMLGKVF